MSAPSGKDSVFGEDGFRRLSLSEYAAAGILDVLRRSGAIERCVSYKPVFGVYSDDLVEIFDATGLWLRDEDLLRMPREDSRGMFDGVLTARGFAALNRKMAYGHSKITIGQLIADHQTTHSRIENGESGRKRYRGLLGWLAL